MPNKKNKVKFNICNVHYALITVSDRDEQNALIEIRNLAVSP